MKVITILSAFLLPIIFLFSCISTQETVQANKEDASARASTIYNHDSLFADRNFWNTSTKNGELIIIGVGGVKISRVETIKGAVEDAARRASLFNQVRANVTYTERIGDGFLDYFIDNQQSIVFDEYYQKYIDELKYDPETDVLITNNAAFVRTRWMPPVPFSISYAPSNHGRPSWTDNPPPTIGGMITGVGYSSPLMYHRAYVASYESAVYSIAIRVDGNIKAEKVNYQGEGMFAYSNSSESTMTASAQIKGFYILQIWVDPKTDGVYTLAVAQETSK
ncbi:MAG: hypothetical protein LBH75_05975 [Treponema sp.]|jgi:hypothetical protein|nr:hypothetical protein [Treponema sp.]